MVVTAANVADITQVYKLLHGQESVVCADAGYTSVEKRPEHEGRQVIWQIAARRSTYKKHGKRSALYKVLRKIEKAKAQVSFTESYTNLTLFSSRENLCAGLKAANAEIHSQRIDHRMF